MYVENGYYDGGGYIDRIELERTEEGEIISDIGITDPWSN